ncbi:MAG: 50S ribosomal protein L21 [Thermodesulfobacteriaceae bacterium]|nr:50S ribosomal protein L21 [Thermodesulfobacteriaceae bacterium]MCX8041156.1 50S ribosomal protein L21 [Thermodesulfobacteriaceae bacterium]MDW8135794.1 50S ribosomal protein L21 [Thermodesulfobacterium sp.]
MLAVIQTGGKQYVVKPGQRIKVEKLEGEIGDSIELSKVLLIKKEGEIKIGQPYLNHSKVLATILEQGKAPKVIVFKKKPKKGYKRKKGHRQLYTLLEIKEIIEE